MYPLRIAVLQISPNNTCSLLITTLLFCRFCPPDPGAPVMDHPQSLSFGYFLFGFLAFFSFFTIFRPHNHSPPITAVKAPRMIRGINGTMSESEFTEDFRRIPGKLGLIWAAKMRILPMAIGLIDRQKVSCLSNWDLQSYTKPLHHTSGIRIKSVLGQIEIWGKRLVSLHTNDLWVVEVEQIELADSSAAI